MPQSKAEAFLAKDVEERFLAEKNDELLYDTQTLIRITHPAVMLVSIPLTKEDRIEFLNGRTS